MVNVAEGEKEGTVAGMAEGEAGTTSGPGTKSARSDEVPTAVHEQGGGGVGDGWRAKVGIGGTAARPGWRAEAVGGGPTRMVE
jgi:hypothetical protein